MRTIISILIILVSMSALGQDMEKRKIKDRILGNKVTTKSVVLGFPTWTKGSEMGIIIKIKKSPTYIKEFNAVIVKNEYDTLKFRFHIYDLKDGKPNKRILEDEIIFIHEVHGDDLTIDLRDYDIKVNDDFFISLEWISDEKGKELSFSGGLFGEPAQMRGPGDNSWSKYGDKINVGFIVRAAY